MISRLYIRIIGLVFAIFGLSFFIYSGKQSPQCDVASLMVKYRVPGVAIAMIENSNIASVTCYGYRNKENKSPLQPDSVFQAGSISKTLTAWGILCLVERKIISLDDPLEQHLHRWRIPGAEQYPISELTIRRVLNHTAGLSEQNYSGYSSPYKIPSISESLDGAKGMHRKLHVEYPPGSRFRYTGGGYTILQLLVEELTGESFQNYMASTLIRPLGLLRSTFSFTEQVAKSLCTPYGIFADPLPDTYFVEQAAAGLYTTIEDLASFISYNLTSYHTPGSVSAFQMMPSDHSFYALGYEIDKLAEHDHMLYHLGANPGWRAGMFLIPSQDSGLAILTNSDNGMHLIHDLASQWTFSKTGKFPAFYSDIQKERQITRIISMLMGCGLLMHVLYAIGTRKKRAFHVSFCKTLLQSIAWAAIALTWLIMFYTSYVHPDRWVLGAFMPYEFHHLTRVIFCWSIFGCVLSCFPAHCARHECKHST